MDNQGMSSIRFLAALFIALVVGALGALLVNLLKPPEPPSVQNIILEASEDQRGKPSPASKPAKSGGTPSDNNKSGGTSSDNNKSGGTSSDNNQSPEDDGGAEPVAPAPPCPAGEDDLNDEDLDCDDDDGEEDDDDDGEQDDDDGEQDDDDRDGRDD